jgi:hypothetical protein
MNSGDASRIILIGDAGENNRAGMAQIYDFPIRAEMRC